MTKAIQIVAKHRDQLILHLRRRLDAREYRVVMMISGREVPSSCVRSGPLEMCRASAFRLNANAHPTVTWAVLPVVGIAMAKEA